KTKLISVEDATRDVAVDAEIDTADYPGITVDPPVVSVIVPIADTPSLRVFDRQIQVRKENPRYTFELETSRIKVFVRAPRDGAAINEDSIDVYVDCSVINAEKLLKETKKNYALQELPVKAVLSGRNQDALILKVIPKKVIMRIFRK
ncbi:MAG TPA: hypothetical protein PK200_16060, partial [Spirochaetota bacterium]|nr:hypothetical protein [Spirochaetota bacterium]